MSYSVLYYPNFQPNLAWLKAMLLVTDSVERIVPPGIELDDSVGLLNLLSEVPDALLSIPPEPSDVELDDRQLERLDKVFRWVARQLEANPPRERRPNEVDEMVRQRVFLHQAKASHRVLELLAAHRLINPAIQDIGAVWGAGDRLILPRIASSFLLSIIAERMSGRTGRDVVTDEILPASFVGTNFIKSTRADEVGVVEGQIGQAFVGMFIPASINRLPLANYLRLREEMRDLRYAFRELVRECAAEYDLNRRPEASLVRERVEQAVIEYACRYADFRRRDEARRITKWVLFSSGIALGLLKGAAESFKMALGFGEAGIKVSEKVFGITELPERHNDAFKMFTKLDKRLSKMLPVEQWY